MTFDANCLINVIYKYEIYPENRAQILDLDVFISYSAITHGKGMNQANLSCYG